MDQSTKTGEYVDSAEALHAYRVWAKFWDSTGGSSGIDNMAPHRRAAWKAYYRTLSVILQHDFPYSPASTSLGMTETPSPRFQERAEIKRVETIYESLLLKETHFPKANENNLEIEEWADEVISNWRCLCGPAWSDEDLGEGGKEAVGRGVLDVSIPYGHKLHLEHQVPLTQLTVDSLSCCIKNIPFNSNTPPSIHSTCISRGV
jgi:cargo-transport protein YPP1